MYKAGRLVYGNGSTHGRFEIRRCDPWDIQSFFWLFTSYCLLLSGWLEINLLSLFVPS